jgi:hypothetical protein
MNQTSNRIDPLTTQCVLRNLGLAIDEIKLIRSINSVNEQVALRGAAQLELGRRRYLISELRFLKKRLQVVREKAELN